MLLLPTVLVLLLYYYNTEEREATHQSTCSTKRVVHAMCIAKPRPYLERNESRSEPAHGQRDRAGNNCVLHRSYRILDEAMLGDGIDHFALCRKTFLLKGQTVQTT